MDTNILDLAKNWATNTYFAEADRKEIADLINILPASELELTERFYRDLEFGTGGLRAPMGVGQNRMNRYNVRRATQAMANMIIQKFGGGSAVISYDSRHNSKDFAKEVACVFAANGIKAYIFNSMAPTPMLSFGVRYYKAQAGVMITASHNPPIYNGFKAFWNDGAQVTPPVDKEIIHAYNSLTDWNLVKFMNFQDAEKSGLVEWTDGKVDSDFYGIIKNKVIQNFDLVKKDGHKLNIVYTALHGSALKSVLETAQLLGFTSLHSIKEQETPDGDFPTVKSPNPEDPKALKMAVDYMMSANADIVYGTDPDGDRLGVVVNHKGEANYLNGNQIGVLMIYYVFSQKTLNKTLPENALVIKSIVTSPLQNTIVESFGGTVIDTLTGFKWMAGLLRQLELENSKYNFVFASEESFGYMPHCESRDKDGVSSMALMSEAALYYKNQGKTLVDALDEIYEKYGFYYESLLSNRYEGMIGSEKITRIMEYFRNYKEKDFAGDEIVQIEDYNLGKNLPKSNVLSFTFKSGNKIFLRPSGTEPLIKFYTMVRVTEGNLADKKSLAHERVKNIEKLLNEVCEKA